LRDLRIVGRTILIETKELRVKVVDWIELLQGRVHWQTLVNTGAHLLVP
jgi:hypothetical protein